MSHGFGVGLVFLVSMNKVLIMHTVDNTKKSLLTVNTIMTCINQAFIDL